ncbi:MAG TPA: hypothetical protein PK760_10515, partial [Flavobacteriales bacterium]|nr:hypothetical protein [Flavobacteriales bacterium]
MIKGRIRWLYLLVALFSGTVVVDHLLAPVTQHLAVLDERGYQERFGSRSQGWQRTTTINAIVLKLSDGSVLQFSSLGDL